MTAPSEIVAVNEKMATQECELFGVGMTILPSNTADDKLGVSFSLNSKHRAITASSLVWGR